MIISRPLPRVAGPLNRPQYDNSRVINCAAWIEDNRITLIAWWWECDVALRLQGAQPGNPDDFDLFCQCQHEREAHQSGG